MNGDGKRWEGHGENPETHLLVEDGLGLTTVSRLLSVVSSLSLGKQRIFTLLVLGDLVGAIHWVRWYGQD